METGYFEEAPGVKSSTRLNSFIFMFFVIIFNIVWILTHEEISGNFIILDALFLLGVFAPKYLHKLAELAITLKGGKLTPSDKPPR